MKMVLYTQVKGIITILTTILVGISAGLLFQDGVWILGIIVGGIIQIFLLFYPSLEERQFQKEVEHNQCRKEKIWAYEDEMNEIGLKGSLRKAQIEAEKIDDTKIKKMGELNKEENINGDKK